MKVGKFTYKNIYCSYKNIHFSLKFDSMRFPHCTDSKDFSLKLDFMRFPSLSIDKQQTKVGYKKDFYGTWQESV